VAKTLLDGVNECLKRVNIIAGDAAALTSLTDASRQHPIDLTVQVINEGIDELYSSSHITIPGEQKESTMILIDGQREYDLATDLVELKWPMIDKINTTFLFKYPGGYDGLLLLDPEQNDTGLPYWGIISPVNNKLHLDRTPTSQENGRTYTYQYEKDLELTSASSPMPFSNAVFRAMVPAWVQLWKREMRNEFDVTLYKMSLGRASRFVTESKQRTTYSPR
jgi:hypothetical protein